MLPAGTLAYSYVRYSSNKQDDGDSFERQCEMYGEYIARKKWTPAEDKFYELARSGFQGKNYKTKGRKLRSFLEQIEDGTTKAGSVLVIEKINRLTRDEPLDAIEGVIRKVLGAGIAIATISPDMIYTKESLQQFGNLIQLMAALQEAFQASKDKSDWSKWAWNKRAKNLAADGEWSGVYPEWIEDKDGKRVLIPWKVETVRRIVQLAMDGNGANRICKLFNREKVPHIVRKTKNGTKRAKQWNKSYVALILRNRALIGEQQRYKMSFDPKECKMVRQPFGEPVKGFFPAVLTEERFAELQRVVKQRLTFRGRSSDEVRNLFPCLCFENGKGLMLVKGGRLHDGNYYHYLAVPGEQGGGFHFPYQPCEQAILAMVDGVTLKTHSDEAADKIDGLKARMEELDESIKLTKERIKQKATPHLLDLLDSMTTEWDKLIIELHEAEGKTKDAINRNATFATDLIKRMKADPSVRRALKQRIAMLVERIDLKGENTGWRKKRVEIVVTLVNGKKYSCWVTTFRARVEELGGRFRNKEGKVFSLVLNRAALDSLTG